MKENIFPALKLTVVSLILLSGIYSLIMLGIAQLSPNKGKGFIVEADGKTYYENIAQNFTDDKYFWSRPSAVGYNAAGSAGSNKGPSNPDYLQTVQDRIDTFLVYNPNINKSEIPSDIVTASGSGLDPDISIEAAQVQAKRIAAARNISEEKIYQLINENTEKPFLGLVGTEKINVLKLNIQLDKIN
ncbi:MAG: K(+)-transporting ATPase subunit C [Fimbriimonadaceae bacterium]|nr:K(+)-transporting ATPase subunit C [Chitinophagales bacterium]